MTSLTIIRTIAARPSVVFASLVQPGAISQWWGPDAGPVLTVETDPRVGGRFRVRFRMLDGSEHESRGAYLEVEPPHRLVMSWRWETGGDDDGESRVEIELRPTGHGTRLVFTHSHLGSDAARDSHRQGWSGALDKLEAMFGAGGESDEPA